MRYGKPVCFGLQEFYLMTGLNCCVEPDNKVKAKCLARGVGFLEKVCGGEDVRGENLLYLMEQKEFSKDEKLKLALMWFLHTVLMARDKTKNVEKWWIQCVDNLDFFSKYPWGRICYDLTLEYLYNKVDLAKIHRQHEEGKTAGYALFRFPWAFLAWIYEAVPLVGRTAGKSEQSPLPIPRMLRWQQTRRHLGDVQEGQPGATQILHHFLIPTVQEVERCQKFVSPYADEVEDPALDSVRAQLKGVTGIRYIVEEYANEEARSESQEDGGDDVVDGGDGGDGRRRGTCRHCTHVEGVLSRMLEVNEEILKLLKEKKKKRERKTKSSKLMKRKLFKHRKIVKRKKKVNVEVDQEEKSEAAVDGGEDAAVEEESNNGSAVDGADEVMKEKEVEVEEGDKFGAAFGGADEMMKEKEVQVGDDEKNAAASDGEHDMMEEKQPGEKEPVVAVEEVDVFNGIVNQVLVNLNEQFPSANDRRENS